MTTHTRTTMTTKLTLGLALAGGSMISSADVPIAITAFNGAEITRTRTIDMTTLQDLTSVVPIQRPGQAFFIRGVGSTDGIGTGLNGGGAQLAGWLGGAGDIQRVEVLRGPQGTLWGRNAQAGVITIDATVGNLDNTTYDPGQDHSSSYLTAGLKYENTFDVADGKLSLVAGLAYTYYDKEFKYRDGDNNLLHDYFFAAHYTKDLSTSSQLNVDVDLNYGEHGTVPRGYTWAGALQNPVFDFKANADVTFRRDGGALTDPGLLHRTGIHVAGFRESSGDYTDSTRFWLSHELIKQRTQTEGIYGRLEIGLREWKVMSDYDSNRVTAVGGLFGELPCGAQYRAGIGVEFREYDGIKLDDRTVPTAEASIFGNVGKVRYSIGGRYGIFDKYSNWGGGNGVDMEGLEFGARFNVPITPKIDFGVALESSYLKAESSSTAMGHIHYLHSGVSLGYDIDNSTRLNLNAGIDRVNVNTGFTSRTDSFGTVSFGIRRRF